MGAFKIKKRKQTRTQGNNKPESSKQWETNQKLKAQDSKYTKLKLQDQIMITRAEVSVM